MKPYCPDILALAVAGVSSSPSCWGAARLRQAGFNPDGHTCPDHATFDFWVETPGTGWYSMCLGDPGFDGVNPAVAIELDRSWLSWNQSSDSLLARLTRPYSPEETP
jgi:hypothetical protein